MSRLTVPALILACLLGAVTAQAALPAKMSYQGRLTLAGAGPVPDSTGNTVVFRLWDAASGGTNFWTETWNSGTSCVSTKNGLFSVELGTFTTLSTLPFDVPYFLEIQVNGDATPMSPRQPLDSGPYAFRAKNFDLPLSQSVSTGSPAFAITNTASTAILGVSSGNQGVVGKGLTGVKGEAIAPGGIGLQGDWTGQSGAYGLKVSGPSQFDNGLAQFNVPVTMTSAAAFNQAALVVNQSQVANGGLAVYAASQSSATAAIMGESFDPTLPGPGGNASAGLIGKGAIGVIGVNKFPYSYGVIGAIDATGNTYSTAVFAINSGLGTGLSANGLTGTSTSSSANGGVGLVASDGGHTGLAMHSFGNAIFDSSGSGNSVTFNTGVTFTGPVYGISGSVPNPLLLSNTVASAVVEGLNGGTGVGVHGDSSYNAGTSIGILGTNSSSSGQRAGLVGNSTPGAPPSLPGVYGVYGYSPFSTAGGFTGFSQGISATAMDTGSGVGGTFQGVTGVVVVNSGLGLSITAGGPGKGIFVSTASGYGVGAVSQSGLGVNGISNSNTGVRGDSNTGDGIYGVTTSGNGVRGQSTSGIGVAGLGFVGVSGTANSGTGIGVFAWDNGFGGSATALSVSGKSVFNGFAQFNGGSNLSVGAPLNLTNATSASTIYASNTSVGYAIAASGGTGGIVTSSNNVGLSATASGGTGYAVFASGSSTNGTITSINNGLGNGVYGFGKWGVAGTSNASGGSGIFGFGTSFADAIVGQNNSSGYGVIGDTTSGTGDAMWAKSSSGGRGIVVQGGTVGVSVTANGASAIGVLSQISITGGTGIYAKATVNGSKPIIAEGIDIGISVTASQPNATGIISRVNSNTGDGLLGQNDSPSGGTAIRGSMTGAGNSGRAVYGINSSVTGVGVRAENSSGGTALQVAGSSTFVGGTADFSGTTVVGLPAVSAPLSLTSSTGSTAISGFNTFGGNGLFGQSTVAGGSGVYARSTVAGARAITSEGFDIGLSATASSGGGTAILAQGNGIGVSASGSTVGVYGSNPQLSGPGVTGYGLVGVSGTGQNFASATTFGGTFNGYSNTNFPGGDAYGVKGDANHQGTGFGNAYGVYGSASTVTGGSYGVYGSGGGYGVYGTGGSYGVYGNSTQYGVWGQSSGSGTTIGGVVGNNTGTGSGVVGQSTSGYAVYGTSSTGEGVHGDANSNSVGVHGISFGSGYGVQAHSNTGTGLFADAGGAAGTAAVMATAFGTGAYGVQGTAGSGIGGSFSGLTGVVASGTNLGLQVTGGALINGLKYPVSDGAVGWVVATNGAGQLSLQAPSSPAAPLSLTSATSVTALSVYNTSTGYGILGQATVASGTGIVARANVAGAKALVAEGYDLGLSATASASTNGIAVLGRSSATNAGLGTITGINDGTFSTSTGVYGQSNNGYGVMGSTMSSPPTPFSGAGVAGASNFGYGVWGMSQSSGPQTPGVWGENSTGGTNSIGVLGTTAATVSYSPTKPAGVYGYTSSVGAAGVLGYSNDPSTGNCGVCGVNGSGAGVVGSTSTSPIYPGFNVGMLAFNNSGVALFANGTTGAISTTASGASATGIYSEVNSSNYAVWGVNTTAGGGYGVYGKTLGIGYGVYGNAPAGVGVYGNAGGASPAVYATNNTGYGMVSSGGTFGLSATASSGTGMGVYSRANTTLSTIMGINDNAATTAIGINGFGNGSGIGVKGSVLTPAAGSIGVYGVNTASGGYAMEADNTAATGASGAAIFAKGPIKVQTNTTASGGANQTLNAPAGHLTFNTGGGFPIKVTNSFVTANSTVMVTFISDTVPVPLGFAVFVPTAGGSFTVYASTSFSFGTSDALNFVVINQQ